MKIFYFSCFILALLSAYPFISVYSEEDSKSVVLTLGSALEWALRHNRQLLNSQDNIVKAQYQVDIANSDFDLMIKPTGDAGYVGGGKAGQGSAFALGMDFSKKFSYGTKVVFNPAVTKAAHLFHSSVRSIITQPLLRGFGQDYTFSNLAAAQFTLRTSIRNFYSAQCHLIAKTITSLYDLLKAERQVLLSEESYQRMKNFHQAAILKSKIGLADPLDIYRAETEMRQAEDALKNAQERLQETEDSLRDLLALPADIQINIDIPLVYTPHDIDPEEAVEMAIKNRVEIDQANDQVTENQRLSKIAKDRLWPELNLVLNYSTFGSDQVFNDSWWWRGKRESTWGVGFTTSTDFNPAAEKAAYEQSRIAIETAQRGVDQAVANITFEVKKAMRQLARTRQRIELNEKQIKTSEGELKLAQIKFDRGMANNFDLIQAEKSLRTALLTYWNSLIEHIVGEYNLQEKLGLLLEKPLL